MAVDKLVDSTVLDGYFEDIADAIRGKNGSSDTYTPSEMPAAITAIPSGGGDTIYDAYFNTGFTYTNTTMTTVPQYMFAKSKLASISLSEVTTVDNYAFSMCSSIPSVSLPKCTTMGQYAFQQCFALTSLSLPECTSIDQYAFYRCTNLATISLPKVTSLGIRALAGLSASEFTVDRTLSLPECTTLSNYALQYSGLTSISFPKIQSIGSGMFEGCTSLTQAPELPAMTT